MVSHIIDRSGKTADYDLAAPTVATESLFMVAIINAKEKSDVVTVDVEGAYLNAKMDRTVIMEIGGQIAVVLTHSYPTVYDKYEHNGKIYLRSKKALYGTIEAAKLWYQTLSEYQAKAGFTAYLQDQCVFNKYIKGYQVTMTLHVDDLMIGCVDRSC